MPLMLHLAARRRLAEIDERSSQGCAELEALISIYPDFSPGHSRLAALHEAAGRDAEALRCRMRAVAGEPRNPDNWVDLGLFQLKRLKRLDHAGQSAQNALAIDPGHTGARRLAEQIARARAPSAAAAAAP